MMDDSKSQKEQSKDNLIFGKGQYDMLSKDTIFLDLPQEPNMGEAIKTIIETARDRGNCDVVIDFSKVDIVTNSSLSKLLKLRKLLADHGHRLVFCNVAPATKDVFTVTGLDGIFELADDKFPIESGGKLDKLSPHPHKRRWLKNLVAILIGIVVGVFFRVVIGIPLALIFATDEGLPLDITFILEVFTAFVAGAMAGSLVLRLGWLIGTLTQLLKMVVTLIALGLWIFFVFTEKDVDFSLNFIREPSIRLMIVAIFVAGIGGAIGEKYRSSIWSFLQVCFGFIAAIFVFALHAIGWLLYLYFLYRGGKALFEEGAFFKAILWVLVIGPVVSYGSFFLLLGVAMGGGWIFKKTYNWYAPDLGLEEMEAW
ncbi:MAG: STAS domain-containing protein [Phycisphaerae bacterium]|jgi:anti-anti-sigma factor